MDEMDDDGGQFLGLKMAIEHDDLWYASWFNDDYVKLYSYRDAEEAKQQVAFFLQQLKVPVGSRVLDLGCGTGRHSLALATAGMDVMGVDLSPYLIAQARQLCDGSYLGQMTVHMGDMRYLHDYGTFDYVFSFFTSFGYFPTDAENEAVLREIGSVLRPKGHFVLDYLHPNHVRQSVPLDEVRQIDGEAVHISIRLVDDSVVKSIEYSDRQYQERVKLYDKNVLLAMLDRSGLRAVDIWSDYRGNSLTDEGPRQIFHCQLS